MGICCIIYIKIHMRHEVERLTLFISKMGMTERAINEADNEKLIAMVEFVSQHIREFNDEKDYGILQLLKNKCTEKELTVKMCRAIGMYYFYRNNMTFARDKLRLAINKTEEIGRNDLIAAYSSELGLVFFYEHQHILAEVEYKRVEKLLQDIHEPNRNVLFLHYYRYGILHRTLHEYELADNALEKALSYAEEKAEKGFTLMNIGINFELQSNFDKALKCYEKALDTFEKSDYLSKSTVYNNLAELYKAAGDYKKALKHINKAFEYLDNKDASKLFIYFTTYTEIMILLEEPEKALDKFMEMFYHVEDITVYKSLIIEGIDSLAKAVAKDVKLLKKLDTVVAKLIKYTSAENHEYKKELERCLENIRKYM